MKQLVQFLAQVWHNNPNAPLHLKVCLIALGPHRKRWETDTCGTTRALQVGVCAAGRKVSRTYQWLKLSSFPTIRKDGGQPEAAFQSVCLVLWIVNGVDLYVWDLLMAEVIKFGFMLLW